MISVDFRKAARQADMLAQTADGMRSLADKAEGLASDIGGVWRGETAEAYLRKIDALASQLRSDAALCDEAARAFRAKVEAFQAAEAEAVRILADGGGAGGAPDCGTGHAPEPAPGGGAGYAPEPAQGYAPDQYAPEPSYAPEPAPGYAPEPAQGYAPDQYASNPGEMASQT